MTSTLADETVVHPLHTQLAALMAAGDPHALHTVWWMTSGIQDEWTPTEFKALVAAIVNDEWGDHDLCTLTACRFPIVHPGPCKGWKHTLHLTAPGVYHAVEQARVEKLNAKRVAKIAALKAEGKPIPKSLLKPITYSVPKPPPEHKIGQHAELTGGEAHEASVAANKAAGVEKKVAPPVHGHTPKTAGIEHAAKAAKVETLGKPAEKPVVKEPGKKVLGEATKKLGPEKPSEPAEKPAEKPTHFTKDNLPKVGDMVETDTGAKGKVTAVTKFGDHPTVTIGVPQIGGGTKKTTHLPAELKPAGTTPEHVPNPQAKGYSDNADQLMKAAHTPGISGFMTKVKANDKATFDNLTPEDKKTVLGKLSEIADKIPTTTVGQEAKQLHDVLTGKIPVPEHITPPGQAPLLGQVVSHLTNTPAGQLHVLTHTGTDEDFLGKIGGMHGASLTSMPEAQKKAVLARLEKIAKDGGENGGKAEQYHDVITGQHEVKQAAAHQALLDKPGTQHTLAETKQLAVDYTKKGDKESLAKLSEIAGQSQNPKTAGYAQLVHDMLNPNKPAPSAEMAAAVAAAVGSSGDSITARLDKYLQVSDDDWKHIKSAYAMAIVDDVDNMPDSIKQSEAWKKVNAKLTGEVEEPESPIPAGLKATGKNLGGTHGAYEYEDDTGKKWVFKPTSEEFVAQAEKVSNDLAQAAGLPAATTHVHTIDGKQGSLQEKIEGKAAFGGKYLGQLTPAQVLAIQKQHVLDWLTGNHDAHGAQWIQTPDGQLVEIDKAQSFKHYLTDKLAADYHPNAAYGEVAPVYNQLYQKAGAGQVTLNNPAEGELHDFIQHVQDLPDDQVKDLVRPYAEAAKAAGKLPGGDVDKFLDRVVARKNNLSTDFQALYDKAVPAPAPVKEAEKLGVPETPKGLSEQAKKATETALHTGYKMATEKLAVYQELTPDEFKTLAPEIQDKILSDLAFGKTKFKDPKKITLSDDLITKFGKAAKPGVSAPVTATTVGVHVPVSKAAQAAMKALHAPTVDTLAKLNYLDLVTKDEYDTLDPDAKNEVKTFLTQALAHGTSGEHAVAIEVSKKLGLVPTPTSTPAAAKSALTTNKLAGILDSDTGYETKLGLVDSLGDAYNNELSDAEKGQVIGVLSEIAAHGNADQKLHATNLINDFGATPGTYGQVQQAASVAQVKSDIANKVKWTDLDLTFGHITKQDFDTKFNPDEQKQLGKVFKWVANYGNPGQEEAAKKLQAKYGFDVVTGMPKVGGGSWVASASEIGHEDWTKVPIGTPLSQAHMFIKYLKKITPEDWKAATPDQQLGIKKALQQAGKVGDHGINAGVAWQLARLDGSASTWRQSNPNTYRAAAAVIAATPTGDKAVPPLDRLKAYDRLTPDDVTALPEVYKTAIQQDLTDLSNAGIPQAATIGQKFGLALTAPENTASSKALAELAAKIEAQKQVIADASKSVSTILDEKIGHTLSDQDEQILGDAYKKAWSAAARAAVFHGTANYYSKQKKIGEHPKKDELNAKFTETGKLAAATAVAQAKLHAATQTGEPVAAQAELAKKLKAAQAEFEKSRKELTELSNEIRASVGLPARNMPKVNAAAVKKDAAKYAYYDVAGYGKPLYGSNSAGPAGAYTQYKMGPAWAEVYGTSSDNYAVTAAKQKLGKLESEQKQIQSNPAAYNAAHAAGVVTSVSPSQTHNYNDPDQDVAAAYGIYWHPSGLQTPSYGNGAKQAGHAGYVVDPDMYAQLREAQEKAVKSKAVLDAQTNITDLINHPETNGVPGPKMASATDAYTGSTYEAINGSLYDKPLGATAKTHSGVHPYVEMIDAAMEASAPIDHDVVIYRGVHDGPVIFGPDWNATNLAGTQWVQKSFSSTSAAQSTAEQFSGSQGFVMRILVPGGKKIKGINASVGGSHTHENELILQRGLTFKVIADYGVVDGRRRIDVVVDHPTPEEIAAANKGKK